MPECCPLKLFTKALSTHTSRASHAGPRASPICSLVVQTLGGGMLLPAICSELNRGCTHPILQAGQGSSPLLPRAGLLSKGSVPRGGAPRTAELTGSSPHVPGVSCCPPSQPGPKWRQAGRAACLEQGALVASREQGCGQQVPLMSMTSVDGTCILCWGAGRRAYGTPELQEHLGNRRLQSWGY